MIFRQKHDTAVFERFALTNGIPVYIQRPPILTNWKCRVTAFLPFVGSCTDPPDAPGTAHFCEHVPLLGTERFPSTDDIRKALAPFGGQRNACVDKTSTSFYVAVTRDGLPTAILLLGDLIAAPRLDEADVVAERTVIAREYEENACHPSCVYSRHMDRLIYGDHPLGHPPIGELATIETMNAGTLRQFHRSHYHAGNLVIVCTGDLPPDRELMELLEAAFSRLPSGPTALLPPPRVPYGQTFEVSDPKLGKDSMVVYYPMPRQERPARYAWDALATCLGGGTDSPLAIELRHRQRLTYRTAGLSSFAHDIHNQSFRLNFPMHRKHFDLGLRIAREALANLQPADWEDCHARHQRDRLLQFVGPTRTTVYVTKALMTEETPLSLHQIAALEDTLRWEDLEACRQRLAVISPFTFRAFA